MFVNRQASRRAMTTSHESFQPRQERPTAERQLVTSLPGRAPSPERNYRQRETQNSLIQETRNRQSRDSDVVPSSARMCP
ncbi:hypothetical protein LZ30DRAFT_732034 [Colletotrichum cereale]|nr:hypothetical protein LZ30DRAFT_732034 [Colletotrichum cereale]